jgi:FMN reductase (NADPH)
MNDDVLNLLANHRSVRSFQAGGLDDALISMCIRSAQMAATSSNVQGYSLLQIKDEEKRFRLAELTGGQAQVHEAGAFFVISAEQRRHRLLAQDQGTDYEANLETFLVGTIDASLFAQNLVVSFESQGLGTCFIGGLRNDLRSVSELLDVPPDVFPLFGLCVGKPLDESETKPRLATESVLSVDRFPTDEVVLEQIAEYDERMGTYYADRDLAGRNWSGGVKRKFAKRTREALHDYYEGQGARLR